MADGVSARPQDQRQPEQSDWVYRYPGDSVLGVLHHLFHFDSGDADTGLGSGIRQLGCLGYWDSRLHSR